MGDISLDDHDHERSKPPYPSMLAPDVGATREVWSN